MSDSLRDHIAATNFKTIQEEWGMDAQVLSLQLADAVIEALGLEVERGGTYAVGGEATSHRYITEWIADE
jgi:hypothetical protein